MTPLVTQATENPLEPALQGDRSAMNRLMAAFRTELLRKAKAVPGRRQDDSDLVQECLLVAAARFGEFQGRTLAEFRAWLKTILDYKILHHQRHWGRKKRDCNRQVALVSTSALLDGPVGSTRSILDRLAQQEECTQLRVVLDWCRAEEQELILQHLWKDRSHEEIAAEWGISAVVVRQRFSRAIRRVGEARRLQVLMTSAGIPALQQYVVGVHRFQRVDATTIADRLMLPAPLVARWIVEGKPFIRKLTEADP